MSSLTCPACAAALDSRGPETRCDHCQARYGVRALCPTCRQPLERLRACGAVDYFCHHCNNLVSKRAVAFELIPVDPA